jgi:trehalose/maltose hydrolase-like predicted phosphorylase
VIDHDAISDGWSITESRFDPALGKAYEGLFTLGSGLLHVRGSLEEHLFGAPQNLDYTRRPANVTAEKFAESKTKWGAYNPGVRGLHPLLNRGIANLPFFLGLAPYVGEEKLDMEASQVLDYERSLHMKTAVLARKLTWQTRLGPRLQVAFERFVSASRPGVCVQRLRLASDRPVRLRIVFGIDGDVRTFGYDMFSEIALSPDQRNGIACVVKTNSGDQAWMLSRVSGNFEWKYEQDARSARRTAEIELLPVKDLIIEKRTAVTSSFDQQAHSPGELLDDLSQLTYDDLLEEQAIIWRKRWAKADVIIEGDDRSQLAIRASLFHLLRAHPDDGRLAIDPKAYAGDAYRGCYFWDTEMYMLPFFLYTDPERARKLLEYRIHSLPGALQNAATTGYRGARYAWEADIDGTETCPNWQYRDHEVHVTADVAYALAHYAALGLEPDFLAKEAKDVIRETARYWLDRVDWRLGDDYPSLLGVMGPDEYTPISSNNSYTNRLAAFNLALAADLGAGSGLNPQELSQCSDIAAKLPILRSKNGELVLQCEEFKRLAEPVFERFWLDRSRSFAAQVAQERLYRSKCLKQADVLMLMLLFPNEFSDEEVRAAWEYYLPYTTHDSSLSAGAHAIIACRLGLLAAAWEFWEISSLNDLDFSGGGAAEGVHIAGAGVNWQIVVFGFAGMQSALASPIFSLVPRLPERWHRLAFPINWQGQGLYIEITHKCIRIANRSNRELQCRVYKQQLSIPGGAVHEFTHE